jgi:hypothetical protein
MDKLIEREEATRNPLVAAPALAVQFFLIPLAVVAIAVGVYVGFRSLLADDRGPQEYLAEIQNGGSTRRWPAASELSRVTADPKVRAQNARAGAGWALSRRATIAGPPVSGARNRPARFSVAPAAVKDLTDALQDPTRAHQRHLGARLVWRSCGRKVDSIVSIARHRRGHPQDGCTRSVRCRRADRHGASAAQMRPQTSGGMRLACAARAPRSVAVA